MQSGRVWRPNSSKADLRCALDRDVTFEMRKTTLASATFALAEPQTAITAIPVQDIWPWALVGGLLCLLACYFVGAEQGATSLFPGMYVHEFVHDGRHLLGFPCH